MTSAADPPDHSTRARSNRPPKWVDASIDLVRAARGQPPRLHQVFHRSSVPMVIFGGDQRYVTVNAAARLSVRLNLAEVRRCRFGDLAAPDFRPEMEHVWARLVQLGSAAGRSEIASPVGARLKISYFATASAVPDRYLAAFAPADWPEDELLTDRKLAVTGVSPLSRREAEVLELVAEGLSAKMIADELLVSPATIKTHLANIYEKLKVRDRAAAVATAMRLGLIT